MWSELILSYSSSSSLGGGVGVNGIDGKDVRLFLPLFLDDFNDSDDLDDSVKIVGNASYGKGLPDDVRVEIEVRSTTAAPSSSSSSSGLRLGRYALLETLIESADTSSSSYSVDDAVHVLNLVVFPILCAS